MSKKKGDGMQLLLGDCLYILKKLEPNSIDSVVTDPPYGLSFMNKQWDYDVPSVELWRAVLRVLKPGGHVLSFGGTRTYHRMVVNMEDAGFEIRDQVQWIYGSGFPKSHNLKDDWQGWGTALKPANEPICLARKPLEKGLTVAENVEKWGTGAINIDWSRVGTDQVEKGRAGRDAPQFSGKYNNGKIYEGKKAMTGFSQGRWPANVIFDEAAAETLGEASRFFYVAKASKRERNAGLEGMPLVSKSHIASKDGGGGGWTKDAHKNPNLPRANHHPTVKPLKLMEYLIKLVTPPKGVVLDPFMGSGSTGVAAKKLGFQFVGIERDREYWDIATKRIEFCVVQTDLLDQL